MVAVLNAHALAYKPATSRGLCELYRRAVFSATSTSACLCVSFLKQMPVFDSAAAWIRIHSRL